MFMKSSLIKPIAFAALCAAAGVSQAAITVYTTQASFLAAVTGAGVDTFSGLSITAATPSPLVRSAGTRGYTATASTTSFFGAGTTADPWLSTNTATDTMSFGSFTGGTTGAIGGNFFGSDITGSFVPGTFTLIATDSTGATSTQTLTSNSTSSFLGFVSTGSVTGLTFTSVQPAGSFVWPTVDNLTLAVAAVPEPQTYAMMLAGLGLMGFMARRRRG